jgi:hypothetical protein
MSAVFTLSFGEGVARDHEARLCAVAEVAARIAAAENDAVLVLPGGFAQATSVQQRDDWADGLLAASRDVGLGLVFGLDVSDQEKWGMEGCPRSFAYACDRGRPLLWAAPPVRGRGPWAHRAVTFAALRTIVLHGREVFQPRARDFVDEKRPDLVMLLAHAAPTQRWLPALQALDGFAPTLLVYQGLRVRRPVWTGPPRGFSATVTEGPAQVGCYRREAVGAPLPVVGH